MNPRASLLSATLISALLGSVQCRSVPERTSAEADLVAGASDSPPLVAEGLDGSSWKLVKFEGGDGATATPAEDTEYTIAFGADGRLTARIDCNRGIGTWKSSGPPMLEFGPLALTRAMCASGSLHDRIVRHWPYVRSYVIQGGHLYLSLMADGGIYEFEPAAREGEPKAP